MVAPHAGGSWGFIILTSPTSFSFSAFIQNYSFLLGSQKAAHYCVLCDSSWLERGLSVLPFAEGLVVLQIPTWTCWLRGLLLLDIVHPDLESPFCPACKQSKRKEVEFVKYEKQVIVINKRLY